MKTGVHPIRVHLKLFFKWGIEFDEEHPYTVQENGNREVKYANKDEIIDGIKEKYPQPSDEKLPPNKGNEGGGYIPPDQMMDDGNYPAPNRRIEESSDNKTDEPPMDNNDLETAEKEEKHSSFGGLTDEKLQGIEKESQSEQNNH